MCVHFFNIFYLGLISAEASLISLNSRFLEPAEELGLNDPPETACLDSTGFPFKFDFSISLDLPSSYLESIDSLPFIISYAYTDFNS